MEKLAKSQFSISDSVSINPWADNVDKMEIYDITTEYRKVVDACRFFYRRDPLASTVINKMVDIGINELRFRRNGITENELRVFKAIQNKLLEFSENMALEFLISGLVIPEVKYRNFSTDELRALGIKRYDTLYLPDSMWVRDPKTIIINNTIVTDKPSFYLEIPSELIYFIMNNGVYPDGKEDRTLYEQLLIYYPDFVASILRGEKVYKLENVFYIRRRVLSDSPYPLPYLYPAIEPMKHKRNLRRMDYALSSRVIGAIQLIKLGSDQFPVTEDQEYLFEDIKNQMSWRYTRGRDIERIFQLYGNHTLNIEWVMPDISALINDSKYKDINQDIIFALGFPRILITGETEKSNTSDAQFASMSPVKTMDNFRRKIEVILQDIVNTIAKYNKFKSTPQIYFRPLQLVEFKTFVEAVIRMYELHNISRSTLDELLGFSWEDEVENIKLEQDIMSELKVTEYAPQPFTENPTSPDTNVQ